MPPPTDIQSALDALRAYAQATPTLEEIVQDGMKQRNHTMTDNPQPDLSASYAQFFTKFYDPPYTVFVRSIQITEHYIAIAIEWSEHGSQSPKYYSVQYGGFEDYNIRDPLSVARALNEIFPEFVKRLQYIQETDASPLP